MTALSQFLLRLSSSAPARSFPQQPPGEVPNVRPAMIQAMQKVRRRTECVFIEGLLTNLAKRTWSSRLRPLDVTRALQGLSNPKMRPRQKHPTTQPRLRQTSESGTKGSYQSLRCQKSVSDTLEIDGRPNPQYRRVRDRPLSPTARGRRRRVARCIGSLAVASSRP